MKLIPPPSSIMGLEATGELAVVVLFSARHIERKYNIYPCLKEFDLRVKISATDFLASYKLSKARPSGCMQTPNTPYLI